MHSQIINDILARSKFVGVVASVRFFSILTKYVSLDMIIGIEQ